MTRRRRERLPHPSTDLRQVYPSAAFLGARRDEEALAREVRRLADLRGDDDVSPGESERFAAAAQTLARAYRPLPLNDVY